MMAPGAAASIAFWIDPPAGTSAAETAAPPASGAAVGDLVSPQAMAATKKKAEQKRARSMVTSLPNGSARCCWRPDEVRLAVCTGEDEQHFGGRRAFVLPVVPRVDRFEK